MLHLVLLLLYVRILNLLLLQLLATVMRRPESLCRHLGNFVYFTHHLLQGVEGDNVAVTATRKELSLVDNGAVLCKRSACCQQGLKSDVQS